MKIPPLFLLFFLLTPSLSYAIDMRTIYKNCTGLNSVAWGKYKEDKIIGKQLSDTGFIFSSVYKDKSKITYMFFEDEYLANFKKGSFSLSIKGLKERDVLAFREGYSYKINRTITSIHFRFSGCKSIHINAK